MYVPFFMPALLFILLVSGCASTRDTEEATTSSHISFSDLKASPDSFRDQSVLFGGIVLAAKLTKEGTRIEILQLPLDQSGSPGYDLTQSQGRYIAKQTEFLDPATLPYGTRVTLTGRANGSITLPLDETDYTYPIVEIVHLQVWARTEQDLYIRPYIGPAPMWGPYWGPYWRPWPYYW